MTEVIKVDVDGRANGAWKTLTERQLEFLVSKGIVGKGSIHYEIWDSRIGIAERYLSELESMVAFYTVSPVLVPVGDVHQTTGYNVISLYIIHNYNLKLLIGTELSDEEMEEAPTFLRSFLESKGYHGLQLKRI